MDSYNPFDPVSQEIPLDDELAAFDPIPPHPLASPQVSSSALNTTTLASDDSASAPSSASSSRNLISSVELDKLLTLVQSNPALLDNYPPQLREAIQNQLQKKRSSSSSSPSTSTSSSTPTSTSSVSSPSSSLSLSPPSPHETNLVDLRKFFAACKTGNLPEARSLLSSGKVRPSDRDEEGNTALHFAAFRDALDVLRFLLDEHRAPLDPQNHAEHNTPLHWAVMGGSARCAAHLLRHGANLFASDRHGYNALHHAAQHDRPLIACYLIRKGLSLDSLDNGGHTPLHWAAYAGHEHLARMFVSLGADAHRRDLKGMTPLHLAASKGHLPVFRILVAAGAAVDAEDNSGRTPRSLAQDDGILRELARAGSAEQRPLRALGLRAVLDPRCFYHLVGALALPFLMAAFWLLPFWLGLPVVFAVAYFLVHGVTPRVGSMPEKGLSPMLVIFLSTYGLSEYVYFFHMHSHMALHPLETILFAALQLWFWAGWAYVKYRDPGFLPRDASGQALEELVARIEGGQHVPAICTTCLVPRPDRSKHCRNCDRCVVRHDHHCSWMGVCVGQRTHFVFVFMLMAILLLHAIYARICVAYILEQEGAPSVFQVLSFIHFAWTNYTPLFIFIVFHMLNVLWQTYVLYWQLQGIRSNVTTSEILHFQNFFRPDGTFFNPYDRGALANILELFHPSYVIDYSKQFTNKMKNTLETV